VDNHVPVTATINLPGLGLGREALVDPDDPYIADCLARGYLVREATRGEAAEVAPDPVVPDDDEPGGEEVFAPALME
jgi:hypothetical protein